MRYLLIYALLLGASHSAAVHSQALKVFESVPMPDEWNDIGIPDPDTELSLSILLRPVRSRFKSMSYLNYVRGESSLGILPRPQMSPEISKS
jgi:hypothetical protein